MLKLRLLLGKKNNIENIIFSRRKNIMKKTITIAEVLLAGILLAVVLSGILMLFINCMLLNEANRNSTVAITHAQYVMEEIRSTSFGSIQTMANNGTWDLDDTELAAAPYNLTVLDLEVIDTTVTSVGNLLEVEIGISWEDRRGRERSEQLMTRMIDY